MVKDKVIYFAADGKYRSKIGISPQRSKAVLGSYDADNKVLTIVQFSQPAGVTDYVNSLWKIQDNPYGGDAANSYNDGPPEPGAKPLGPFYELESSSPAAALAPRQEPVARASHRCIWSGRRTSWTPWPRTLGVPGRDQNGLKQSRLSDVSTAASRHADRRDLHRPNRRNTIIHLHRTYQSRPHA